MKAALDFLRETGWCKYVLKNDAGERCIVGAMRDLANDDDLELGVYGEQFGLVVAVIREQYPDRLGLISSPIPSFNDHPDTTFADVELVLEKAQLRFDETVRP